MTQRVRLLLIAAAALGALGSPAAAIAQTKLVANVGRNDAFVISLATSTGQRVSNLPAGVYEIEVNDHSEHHNFRLSGPGVEMFTAEAFVGTVTWTVTLQDAARYTFNCDPHFTRMRGSFTTGGGPPVQPQPPPAPKPNLTTLTATVGPGFTIALRTHHGARVNRLKAGRYRIVVRDRSAAHNFHLTGAGVNKKTGIGFRGTATWTVTLRKGQTYRFRCDPHAAQMKGRFRAT